jgi:hypothetical protein
LQFGASKVELDVLDSELGSGRLSGQLSFFSGTEGISALSYFELDGAQAAEIVPAEGRTPINGIISMKTTIEGAGLSPAAFVGSLQGSGSILIEDAEFVGLNPRVFDALTRAAALGAGYRGSLNLTLAEARDLGSAIGCEFFFTGKAGIERRSACRTPASETRPWSSSRVWPAD